MIRLTRVEESKRGGAEAAKGIAEIRMGCFRCCLIPNFRDKVTF